MIKLAVLGLGKMGLSHQAIVNTHPDVELAAVCDSAEYVLGVLAKYAGVRTYTDYRKLLASEALDAVMIATPSRLHAEMTQAALDAGLHVFCEKPFVLDAAESLRLAELAEARKRVNQVGYHYRFIGVFQELKRLVDLKVLGRLHHIRAEAHGPVVLRPKGSTWRASKVEGGGCLHDYASHAVDLMNYLVGPPVSVSGTSLNRLFSNDVEDEVYSTFQYADSLTGHVAANWSDESNRKMSMKVTLWGTNGKAVADRQEMQIYLRDTEGLPPGFCQGWNVRYTTDLTQEVWFYLRGEEYSAEVDHFVQAVKNGRTDTRSTFRTATETQLVLDTMTRDSTSPAIRVSGVPEKAARRFGLRSLVGFGTDTASA